MNYIHSFRHQLKAIPFLLLLSLFVGQSAFAQVPEQNETYLQEEMVERSFDKEEWKSITEGVTFDKKEKKEKKKEKADTPTPIFTGFGDGVKYFFYGLMILILAGILIKIFTSKVQLTNKKVQSTRPFNIEEVETNLHESDLDRYLRESLANKSYRTAVRIYYLMIIKELSSNGMINWKKDKTNREYISEMRSQKGFESFRDITRTFDKVWYGEFNIQQNDFAQIGPKFEQFITQIKS